MSNEDLEIEDLLKEGPKKKIKTGQKGKRVERDVVHILNARFQVLLSQHPDWGMFSRTIGSGNRWGQGVVLSSQAKQTFSGDIAVPTNFIWTIESKGGYNDVDLNAAFEGGVRQLDEFIKQVSDDAARTNRKPIILWKKDRKPRLAILLDKDFGHPRTGIDYIMKYREWIVVNFEHILASPDSFFFTLSSPNVPEATLAKETTKNE